MRRTSFAGMPCSIARSLEIVGEWWTLLIVRDLLLGVRRFEEFHDRLGIARNILTDRLATLVDSGIVERRAYQQRPERFEYVLTAKGRDLWTVVTAMREWGDRWEPPEGGPPLTLEHQDCGGEVLLGPVCATCGDTPRRRDLSSVVRDDLPASVRAVNRAS